MIILDCVQYSPEWWAARLGILTGSATDSVLTPTCRKSSTWLKSQSRLAAERIWGAEDGNDFASAAMERGHVVEEEARAAYEFITGHSVTQIGLAYMNEKKECAFSADGLIQDDILSPGGLEIKAPQRGIHWAYRIEGIVPAEYKPQVYGSLYMSGYDWWDFMSYHPDLPEFIVRTTKEDENYIKFRDALDAHLPLYLEGINDIEAEMRRSIEL